MKQYYSDDELIALLASAETRWVDVALEYIYRKHKSMIIRLVSKNQGTQQDAEEVVDDALVGLWKAVRTQRYQPTARLKTYLYQIARNIWLKRLRDSNRNIYLIDTELSEDHQWSAGTDELYELKESYDMYWNKIRALGGHCYNVVWAFAQGYTMQEIAVRFDLGSADNAKTIKYNCLKKAGKPIL